MAAKGETKEEIRAVQLAWLRDVLKQTRMSASALGAAAGLSEKALQRFLREDYSGTLSPMTVGMVAKFTGLPGPDAAAGATFGFEEGDPIDYKAASPALAAAIATLIRDRPNAAPWRLRTRALESMGYLKGDIVIVDMAEMPRAGDPVCAQLYDLRHGTAETIFRVYQPPYVVPATLDASLLEPLLVDDRRVIVRGVITELLRVRERR